MQRNLKNGKTPNTKNKGITLVALVITIIVLLILAGVAISMAINSDGLFGKANEAAEGWNSAVEEERTAIQDLLNKFPIELPAEWDSEKVGNIVIETSALHEGEEAKERKAPIPVGYAVSQIGGENPENTIAGGLVIYKQENGITEVTSGNHAEALEKCDQFVWIPVDDINSMVMCKLNGKATKADGTATEGGKTVCNLEQETDGTLKCTTHNSSDLAGRLYRTYTDSSSSGGVYTRKLDFSNTAQTYNADSDRREPANLNSTYGDISAKGLTAIKAMLQAEGKTYEEDATYNTIKADWLKLQQADFDSMAESVARYGGFYISRYEIGVGGISKKNKDVLRNNSDENNWWGMYSTLRAEGKTMIWGSQYDQVIKFIGEQAQVGHNDRNLTTSPSKSGLNDLDLMNNIYDLEGNLSEWTSEAEITLYRVSTGGFYGYAVSGNFYPASYRGYSYYPTFTNSNNTTRSSLYL